MTYPTLSDVNQANEAMLRHWNNTLPDPQTDVERTIQRRIKKALHPTVGDQLKKEAPELHKEYTSFLDHLNDILNRENH
jgi:hypothetical protein